MKDSNNRGIEYLRISVTDRCNFRCKYCMPPEGVKGITHDEVLSFEEIVMICRSMATLGIRKIKLTGGEPLVRKGLISLVRQIKAIKGIEEITLTTNGFLLSEQLEELIEAGITQINVSLDTLDAQRFREITRIDGLDSVLKAIYQTAHSRLGTVKVNVLAAQGMNEGELIDLAALAKEEPIHIRFIELMPIGRGTIMAPIKKEEIIHQLEEKYGKLVPYFGKMGNGPAQYYEIEGFKGKIGFISAVSDCFCEDCNRVRLTANGFLKLCLHSTKGLDLRKLLRSGIEQEALTKTIEAMIKEKPERHYFNESRKKQIEDKMMSQIGG